VDPPAYFAPWLNGAEAGGEHDSPLSWLHEKRRAPDLPRIFMSRLPFCAGAIWHSLPPWM
jgi:hypothetical protein